MKILILLCVLYMAWMPVSFGIQGLHFKQENKPIKALLVLLCAWIYNLVIVFWIGPRISQLVFGS